MKHILNYNKWYSVCEAANGKFLDLELASITVQPGENQSHKLNPEAASDYNRMVAAAAADGISWGITDSYRPLEIQDKIFDWDLFNRTGKKSKKGTGGRVAAAFPGTSNHGWGSAVDLKVKKGDAAHTWLTQNASKFGFSPLASEPWHWDHVSSASKYKSSAPVQTNVADSATSSKPTLSSDELNRFQQLVANLRSSNYSAAAGSMSLIDLNNRLNAARAGDIKVIDMEDIKTGSKTLEIGSSGEQVSEIQRKLKELNFLKKEPTGEFDTDTVDAVKNFQSSKGIPSNGEINTATYSALYPALNTSTKVSTNISGKKGDNIKLLQAAMDRHNITNPFTRKAILAVIGKESGYVPKDEYSYAKTSNSRLRKLFGSRLSKFSDSELDSLKANNVEFYDVIYGYKREPKANWNTGNTEPGDGYKYRGRGFNQITFKSSYQRYQDLLNSQGKVGAVDLVNNPDQLNDPNIAAEAAILYFIEGSKNPKMSQKYGTNDLNGFTDQETALKAMTNANAGWGKSIEGTETYAQAKARLSDFSSDQA